MCIESDCPVCTARKVRNALQIVAGIRCFESPDRFPSISSAQGIPLLETFPNSIILAILETALSENGDGIGNITEVMGGERGQNSISSRAQNMQRFRGARVNSRESNVDESIASVKRTREKRTWWTSMQGTTSFLEGNSSTAGDAARRMQRSSAFTWHET